MTSLEQEISCSEMSSVTDSGVMKKEELDYSSEYFPQIDETFWSEDLAKEEAAEEIDGQFHVLEESKIDDSMDFWYHLFTGGGGQMPDLPEF